MRLEKYTTLGYNRRNKSDSILSKSSCERRLVAARESATAEMDQADQ
ncbi:MAG: hypothetical protein NVS2B12_03450 [Ktedonobacteraceae bacterium]